MPNEIDPLSVLSTVYDLYTGQQRLNLANQASAREQEQWDLQKQALQDKIAHLGQDRNQSAMEFLDQRLANGGQVDPTLRAMGYVFPPDLIQSPNDTSFDTRLRQYGNNVADVVEGKRQQDALRQQLYNRSLDQTDRAFNEKIDPNSPDNILKGQRIKLNQRQIDNPNGNPLDATLKQIQIKQAEQRLQDGTEKLNPVRRAMMQAEIRAASEQYQSDENMVAFQRRLNEIQSKYLGDGTTTQPSSPLANVVSGSTTMPTTQPTNPPVSSYNLKSKIRQSILGPDIPVGGHLN